MTTLKSFKIIRDAIATEAFNASDVAAYFKGSFPAVVRTFRDFAEAFSPSQVALVLTPQHRAFQKELPKFTYLDIAPITAYVPEGLHTTYLAYMKFLMDAVDHTSHIMDVMTSYSAYLAQVISNSDMSLSTKSYEGEYKQLQRERESISKDIGACFTNSSSKSEVAIRDVVQRNADWPDVFAQATELAETMHRVNRSALIKKVVECDNHLAVILKMIDSKGRDKVSQQMVTNLADGAYQTASELEFYSATYFKTEVLLASISRTIENFQRVTTK